MDKYDPLNYAIVPARIINNKAGIFFNLKSSLLRIRWQIVSPNRDRALEAIGEIRVDYVTPFGDLPTKRFQLLQSLNPRLVQFLAVPLEDNLPYKITFLNNDPLVTKSSIEVAEFIPYIPSGSANSGITVNGVSQGNTTVNNNYLGNTQNDDSDSNDVNLVFTQGNNGIPQISSNGNNITIPV